jgi:TfoX/Sxy family transcriptional regulator of competence genes
MAYDEELADRIRELIAAEPGLSEKRMFGGLAMLVDGNMAIAASGRGGLLVRVAEAEVAKALTEPGADEAIMRGRPMRGWVTVGADAVATKAELRRWVKRGVAAARANPPK